MAIQNNLTSSSIRKYLPSKVITGYGQTIMGLESWMYDDGFGDQWWQGVIGAPVRWILTADVFPAAHSSHLTRVPNTYTGLDITPGMWVFSVTEPRAVRIVSIISLSDTSIQCIVEDVDRYNTFADASQTGTGAFASNNNLVFFELGDDGLPVLNPLPVGIDLTITSQIESRFRVFNPTVENRFFQLNHGFTEGQVVRIDNATGNFVNATSDDIYIAGTVLAVGPGPHYFYLSPSTKIIDDLEPGLPGVAGDLLGIDPVTGDRAVITGGNNALYIKMTNAVKAFTVGSIDTPVTYPGNIIKLNNHIISFVGDPTVDVSSIISTINASTANHGVTASMGSPSTIIPGTISYPTSTPTTNMQFTINGVTTLVSLPSISFGTSGQVGWWDIIRSVNEQTSMHGVYASFDSNTGFVVFTQAEGLDINFVNVTPSITSGEDKTITDMLGMPENNPAAAATRLKFVRADGGAITVTDVSGQFTIDTGIQSAANGSLPLALVVDKTMTATSSGQMVADIAALNAITNPRSGDQVYVQNGKTPGEWELYVRTGNVWTMIADYDSAKSDASTMVVDVTNSSVSPVTLGNVSNGTRIVNVTVVVSEPFNALASLNVGTSDVVDAVLSAANIDLSSVGSYEANTSYIYAGSADGELFVHIDPAGSTSGKAKVVVSYL